MATETDGVELIQENYVVNVTRMALFAALIGAFAYVSFPNPFSPAPVTLQVLGVFLAGIFLGATWGAGSMALYLVAGAVGAPVFAGGAAGFGVLQSPTAGYLLSYPIAAFVVGLVVHRGVDVGNFRSASLPVLVGAMVAGTAIIYALGIVGLMLSLGLGPVEAFVSGAAVFLPAEAAKIAAAIGIVRNEDLAVGT